MRHVPCPVQAPCVRKTLQVCTKCQIEKAAEEFNRNKVRPDGLCSYCKVCNAAAAAERRRSRAPVTEPTVSHKVRPRLKPLRLFATSLCQTWTDTAHTMPSRAHLITTALP